MININFESQMVMKTIPQSIYLFSQIGQQNFRSNINNGMKLHPLFPSPSHVEDPARGGGEGFTLKDSP